MAVSTAVVRAAANTSTGTQSFTSSGFGTPDAAVIIVTSATANATEATQGIMSIGFTDGANEGIGSAIFSDDVGGGGTSSRTYDRSYSDGTVVNLIANANGDLGTATFDSWTTDGITINWTVAPSAAYLVTVWLFGGSDTSAAVGTSTHGGGDITTVGFEPDIVFFTTTSASGNSGSSNGALGFGVAVNDVGVTQGGVGVSARHTQTTAKSDIILDTTAASSQLFNQSVASETVVSAFDASGFTLTGGSAEVHYLALNFNGVAGTWAGNIQAPGAPSTEDAVGLGFQPGTVGVIGTGVTTTDVVQTSAASGSMSLSLGIAIDGGNEFSNAIRYEDDVSTHDHGSISDSVLIDIIDPGGTSLEVATMDSYDADGFTINYTTSTAAIEMFAWAIEGAATGPAPQAGNFAATFTSTVAPLGTYSTPAKSGSFAATFSAGVAPLGTYSTPAKSGSFAASSSISVGVQGTYTPPVQAGNFAATASVSASVVGVYTPPAAVGNFDAPFAVDSAPVGVYSTPAKAGNFAATASVTASVVGTYTPPARSGSFAATASVTVAPVGVYAAPQVGGNFDAPFTITAAPVGTYSTPAKSGSFAATASVTAGVVGVYTPPARAGSFAATSTITVSPVGSYVAPGGGGNFDADFTVTPAISGVYSTPAKSGSFAATSSVTASVVGVYTPPARAGSFAATSTITVSPVGSYTALDYAGSFAAAATITPSFVGVYTPPARSGSFAATFSVTFERPSLTVKPVHNPTVTSLATAFAIVSITTAYGVTDLATSRSVEEL